MTDQPTDHRAIAEKWLQRADEWAERWEETDAHTAALIGIGHALLAVTEKSWRHGYGQGRDDEAAGEPLDPTGFPLRAGRKYGTVRYDQTADYVHPDDSVCT